MITFNRRAHQDTGLFEKKGLADSGVSGNRQTCICIVFDGHGQADNVVAITARKIAEQNLYLPVKELVSKIAAETVYPYSGSTMAYFKVEGTRVQIALLGDSRVVIVRKKGKSMEIIFQEECINLSSPEERERVESTGARVSIVEEVYRMAIGEEGGLPMSRAFGDSRYKAMLPEPCYFTVDVQEGDYVMAFSDGMTEGKFSMMKEDGIDFMRNGKLSIYGAGVSIEKLVKEFGELIDIYDDLSLVAECMVHFAIREGSTDDITFGAVKV
jgi:serine/threonine protein phosphatase PrpC